MKKAVLSMMCLLIVIIMCSFSNGDAQYDDKNKGNITTVTHDISFKVMDSKDHPIPGARIVIINMNGDVVDIAASDKNGLALIRLTVPIDKRYYWLDPNKMEPRGTVTAIAFKQGYIEQVLFEVPVNSAGSFQQIYLSPIVEGQRNEPEVQLGSSHHLEILSLVSKYSRFLGR